MRLGSILAMAFIVPAAASPAGAQTASSDLKDGAGKQVGTAQLVETPHGVLIKLSLRGLPAGEHAFHIHAVGKCEPPFSTAGGHYNPGGRKHGLEAQEGAHAGDMPNLHIPAGGELVVEVINPSVTLAKGKPHSLFDADGSSLVIHATADDYSSDPTGNAGDRIACGVVE